MKLQMEYNPLPSPKRKFGYASSAPVADLGGVLRVPHGAPLFVRMSNYSCILII